MFIRTQFTWDYRLARLSTKSSACEGQAQALVEKMEQLSKTSACKKPFFWDVYNLVSNSNSNAGMKVFAFSQ